MAEKKSKKGQKGLNKQKPDTNDPNENPLLKIDDKPDFTIESGNLLQNTNMLIFKDFKQFDIKKDKDHFDISQINNDSTIIIALRYYEYVCISRFKFSFIIPILESGLTARDVFEMIKHCLRNRLLVNAPTFDNIFDIEISYTGYIKY